MPVTMHVHVLSLMLLLLAMLFVFSVSERNRKTNCGSRGLVACMQVRGKKKVAVLVLARLMQEMLGGLLACPNVLGVARPGQRQSSPGNEKVRHFNV